MAFETGFNANDVVNGTVSGKTFTGNSNVSNGGTATPSAQYAGKFYFECKFTVLANGFSFIGLGNFAFDPVNDPNSVTNGVIVFKSGNVRGAGNALLFNIGAFVANDVIGVAIDLDNKTAWFRKNSGQWNGSGTADPATNTGGTDITAYMGAGIWPVAGSGNTVGDSVTISTDPGVDTFLNAAPTGFTQGVPDNSAALQLDRHVIPFGASGNNGPSPATVSYSTRGANRLGYLVITDSGSSSFVPTSIVDSGGITWTLRSAVGDVNSSISYITYWASIPTQQTNNTITINWSGLAKLVGQVCFLQNADTTTPFDTGAAANDKTSTTGTSLNGTAITSAATEVMALAFVGVNGAINNITLGPNGFAAVLDRPNFTSTMHGTFGAHYSGSGLSAANFTGSQSEGSLPMMLSTDVIKAGATGPGTADLVMDFAGGGTMAVALTATQAPVSIAVGFTGGGRFTADILGEAPSPSQYTQIFTQIIGGKDQPPVNITQISGSVLGTSTPPLRATQVYGQVLGSATPPMRVTQVYTQLLALRTPIFTWIDTGNEGDPVPIVDELFPKDISENSQGIIRFATDVVQVDSGADQRSGRWDQSLMEYDVSYGVRTMEDLHALIAFFRAMRGRLYGFMFEDHVDHTSTLATATEARAAPDPTAFDQVLGQGGPFIVTPIAEAPPKTFQLVKHYPTPQGLFEQIRTITRPKVGTVKVAIDNLEKANWTVDYHTGIITFTPEYSVVKTLSIFIDTAGGDANGVATCSGAPDDFALFKVGDNIMTFGWATPANNSDETVPLTILSVAADRSSVRFTYDATRYHFGETAETNKAGVTFQTHPAPKEGATVKAGFEFYVPVRFDVDQLPVTLEEYGIGSATQVKLVEIRPGEPEAV